MHVGRVHAGRYVRQTSQQEPREAHDDNTFRRQLLLTFLCGDDGAVFKAR
jgi:hypothetical protein